MNSMSESESSIRVCEVDTGAPCFSVTSSVFRAESGRASDPSSSMYTFERDRAGDTPFEAALSGDRLRTAAGKREPEGDLLAAVE